MAQLYWTYAAMNAGKSAKLLSVAHNYAERGMATLVMKPDIDTRDGTDKITSRLGIQRECIMISKDMNIKEYFKYVQASKDLHCVLIDEAQFLTEDHVMQLCEIVDEYNTPVMCFGLRTDSDGKLFEGSAQLFAWSDKIEELKAVCHCGRKATMVAKMDEEGNPIVGDSQIDIGGDDKYTSFCRKHYREFVKPALKRQEVIV